MKKVLWVLVLWVLILSLYAQSVGIKLEYNLPVGDISKYKITMQGKGVITFLDQTQSINANTEMTITQKVTAVDSQGNLTQTYKVQYDKMFVNNQEMPALPEIPEMTIKMTKYGKILEVKGLEKMVASTGGVDVQSLMEQMMSTQIGFPEKEIAIGESWTKEFKIAIPNASPVTIKTISKLEAIEEVAKQPCAKITTYVEFPMSIIVGMLPTTPGSTPPTVQGLTKVTFTNYFAYQLSKIIKGGGTSTTNMVMNMTMPAAVEEVGPQTITTVMNMNLAYSLQLVK